MVLTILKQVIIMFLLSGVGYVMYRTKKITDEGSKCIGNILIYLSLPCVIINGFLVERTPERITGLLYSVVLAAAALAIAMLVARICFGRRALDNFAASFSNPGFFGVPIIVASFESGAVFYVAAYIAFTNLLQWTYGVSLLKNSDENDMLPAKKGSFSKEAFLAGAKTQLKALAKAPFMVGIIIGLFFFFTAIPMPEIPGKCINFIASVNTPLAMFTVGIYLAQSDLMKMLKNLRMYMVSAVTLLLSPIITMLVLAIMPVDNMQMKMCILIASACPVGSNIAVYAQLHNRNRVYAVETVVISTLFSILTIPLVVTLAGYLF